MRSKKYLLKCIMYIFAIIICGAFASFCYVKSLDKETVVEFDYTENSSIDYKVNLTDNPFWPTNVLTKKELEESKSTIITQYLDHIDFNFSYSVNFSEAIKGEYTYYIKGIINAESPDAETNYWTKEYNLTDKYKGTINNTNSYSFFTSFDVDYNEYNQILNEFKKEVRLTTNGTLTIELVIENTIHNEGKDSKLVSSDVKAVIPLTTMSADITINAKNGNKSETFKETFISDNIIYKLLFAAFIGFDAIILVLIIFLVKTYKQYNSEYYYYKLLKKILSTYDSIIVNVDTLPDTDGFNVIYVKTFDELIDAHSEVRMPINYFNDKNLHVFILVSGNMMWLYKLKTKKVVKDNETRS